MATIVLLNKPYNVLCQFSDAQGRATLADYINTPGIYPAGRLDYDSEGLVVLTDDGKLQHQISHPDKKQRKRYWVQVEGEARDSQLQPLRAGVHLSDGVCKSAKVEIIAPPSLWERQPPIRERRNIPTSWLSIELSEGRNRQVRRMTAAVGLPTLRLVRVTVGDWSVLDLAPGESRSLQVHLAQSKVTAGKSAPGRRSRRRSRPL